MNAEGKSSKELGAGLVISFATYKNFGNFMIYFTNVHRFEFLHIFLLYHETFIFISRVFTIVILCEYVLHVIVASIHDIVQNWTHPIHLEF